MIYQLWANPSNWQFFLFCSPWKVLIFPNQPRHVSHFDALSFRHLWFCLLMPLKWTKNRKKKTIDFVVFLPWTCIVCDYNRLSGMPWKKQPIVELNERTKRRREKNLISNSCWYSSIICKEKKTDQIEFNTSFSKLLTFDCLFELYVRLLVLSLCFCYSHYYRIRFKLFTHSHNVR